MVIRPFISAFLGAALAVCVCATARSQHTITSSSIDLYAHAETLIRAHQWDRGLQTIRQLLKEHPSDPKILNLAGIACTGKRNLKEADTYFRRALQIDPEFVPSLKNLGVNEFTLGDLASADRHLQQALRHAPEDPVINLYLGEIAYSKKNFKDSAKFLTRASQFLSHDPNLKAQLAVSLLETGKQDAAIALTKDLEPNTLTPPMQFALGFTLAQSEMQDRAIPYFESLQKSNPDSYNTTYNLLVCYLRTKKYPEAIALANDEIARGDETSELDNVLADAYEANRQTQKAIDTLRKAIALDPDDDNNYLDFSNICINHNDFENGLKVIAVGLNVHPKSYRLIFERGILYAMEDRFNLAEDDFELSARLAPESNFGYVGMGVTYLETGNAAQAIKLLHTRLREKPNDASLLYLLGEALLRNGAKEGQPDYAESQAALEKSVRLNPRLCLPHVDLGEIYLDEGRYADAVAQLEEARKIDPKEKSAYSHLAVAYRRLGKTEDAKRILNLLKDIYQQDQGWTRTKMKSESKGSEAPSLGSSN